MTPTTPSLAALLAPYHVRAVPVMRYSALVRRVAR